MLKENRPTREIFFKIFISNLKVASMQKSVERLGIKKKRQNTRNRSWRRFHTFTYLILSDM